MTDLQAIPILLSPNLSESVEYAAKLGFETETFFDNYAILRGHGVEIHYSYTERPDVCNETSCYIRGGGILALYETLKAQNAPGLTDMFMRPWGMTEFYLHDPHGNLLKFGMSSDELPDHLRSELETHNGN